MLLLAQVASQLKINQSIHHQIAAPTTLSVHRNFPKAKKKGDHFFKIYFQAIYKI
jgi:hypothetical protein